MADNLRQAVLDEQRKLNRMSLDRLGRMLSRADAARRSPDPRKAAFGRGFYAQILFAMSNEFDPQCVEHT